MCSRKRGHRRHSRHSLPGLQAVRSLPRQQAETYAWLRAQWTAGAWIGANCTGTFLLAQSGLLDGRTATTTWWSSRQFRSLYPKVDLQFRSVLTEADRLVCAGATATYHAAGDPHDRAVHGPDHRVAERQEHADRHQPDGPGALVPLLTETNHTDTLVERAQRWLQKNMDRT